MRLCRCFSEASKTGMMRSMVRSQQQDAVSGTNAHSPPLSMPQMVDAMLNLAANPKTAALFPTCINLQDIEVDRESGAWSLAAVHNYVQAGVGGSTTFLLSPKEIGRTAL